MEVHIAIRRPTAGVTQSMAFYGVEEPEFDNVSASLHALYPGSSMAVKRASRCGRVGPSLSVHASDGEAYVGALAAHHVAMSTVQPLDAAKAAEAPPLLVECPAAMDLDAHIQRQQKTMHDLEPAIRKLHEQGKDAARLQASFDASQNELERATRAKDEDCLVLGRVLASSGNSNRGPQTPLYDWALIRVRPERVGGEGDALDFLPPAEPSEPHPLQRPLHRIGRMNVLQRWLTSIEEGRPHGRQASFAEATQDDTDGRPCAILYGRSSGYTVGYINGMQDDVRLAFGDTEVCGQLYAVLDIGKLGSFSRSGDSGAPVYDQDGRVLGTLIRGNSNCSQIGVSYVVPIQDTLEHMRSTLRHTPYAIEHIDIL